MEKVKLAVCMSDSEYRERLLRCMMNHYRNQYEFYVYTRLQEIQKSDTENDHVLLLGDVAREEISDFINRGEKILFLQEDCKNALDVTMPTNLVYTEKYQEVYKIVDEIEKLAGITEQKTHRKNQRELSYSVIGVYSLSQPQFQLPFAGTVASIVSEQKPSIVIDQQPFSGLGVLETSPWGMEDLMAVATTGVYTRGRLLEGIVHQENWDYLLPVKNSACLAEGSSEIYENMMDILAKELGYKIFVINFGSVYDDVLKQMEYCDRFFYLTSKNEPERWRDQAFFQELKESGHDNFLHKITRIEISGEMVREQNWNKLMQQWRWNEIGSGLRAMVWKDA